MPRCLQAASLEEPAATSLLGSQSVKSTRAHLERWDRWLAGSGKQAGMLHATDEYTAVSVVDSTGVAYAHHTLPGTAVTEGSLARWTLCWVAPRDAAPVDTVYFDAVANASNDDESAFGDRIYTQAVRLKPSPK